MWINRDDKRRCAKREVAQRKRVYPRLVAKGSMSQAEADREIAIMEAIAADYKEKDLFE